MPYCKTFSLASKALLVCFTVLCGAVRGGESQKLAVVNVSYVFEKYLKVADVQKRIDAIHDVRKKELDAKGKELAERNRQLTEMYNQAGNSEQVFDSVQSLRKAQYLYERDVQQLNDLIQKDYTREMREVLSDIRQAIKAHAEGAGFDMVLRSPDSDNPDVIKKDPAKLNDPADADKRTYLQTQEPKTLGEVLERFHRNPVLFGADAVDITADVLKRLNDAFFKRSMTGNPGGK